MIESRFPSYDKLADKDGYQTVEVEVTGKSTWTDPVITDMLDSAAIRKEPQISHVSDEVSCAHSPEETVSTWSRVYYFHPNPAPTKG